MKNSDKIILDLCGGTGSWSKPYKKAGYQVILITLPEYRVDAVEFQSDRLWFIHQKSGSRKHIKVYYKDIYGILAAPPCTMFSLARTNAKRPRDLREGMETVRACLNVIWGVQERLQDTKQKTTSLKFWALENPYGMIKYFLGEPVLIFEPYNYGDAYRKKTALWGHFNHPVFTHIGWERKLMKFDKLKTKEIHPEFYGKLNRTERRAITPQGFAKAFFEANQ